MPSVLNVQFNNFTLHISILPECLCTTYIPGAQISEDAVGFLEKGIMLQVGAQSTDVSSLLDVQDWGSAGQSQPPPWVAGCSSLLCPYTAFLWLTPALCSVRSPLLRH